MTREQLPQAFGREHAADYDRRFAPLSALREALHLLTGAVLADLPAEAEILCVGAGTGAELIFLARKFPGWRFVAVEPSAPMLDVCRGKAEELGLATRCRFHHGFLESLPACPPFDGATSLLVSQFILDTTDRTRFFRAVAERLRPGGILVSADLASDLRSADYASLLEVWKRLMRETGATPEMLGKIRESHGRDVAVLPVEQVKEMIASGGFETPVLLLQTCLIHAWFAQRKLRGGMGSEG